VKEGKMPNTESKVSLAILSKSVEGYVKTLYETMLKDGMTPEEKLIILPSLETSTHLLELIMTYPTLTATGLKTSKDS